MDLARASRAPLDAAYAARFGSPIAAMTDDMMITVPLCCAIIRGITALQVRYVPRTLTSNTRSQVRGGVSCSTPAALMPALATSTSIRPKSATAAPAARSRSSGRVTSAWMSAPRPPAMRISSAVRAAAAPSMSMASTDAPSAANRVAIARPMPEPAPVTRQAFASSRPLGIGARFRLPQLPVLAMQVKVEGPARMLGDDGPVQGHAESRPCRKREVTVSDCGVARSRAEHVVLREVVEVLLDHEVRRARGEVQRRRRRDRPAHVVRRDEDLVTLGPGRDLPGLPQATAHRDVGLHDVDRLPFEKLPEFRPDVGALARSDRHPRPRGNPGQPLRVVRRDRLLDPRGIEPLQVARQR